MLGYTFLFFYSRCFVVTSSCFNLFSVKILSFLIKNGF